MNKKVYRVHIKAEYEDVDNIEASSYEHAEKIAQERYIRRNYQMTLEPNGIVSFVSKPTSYIKVKIELVDKKYMYNGVEIPSIVLLSHPHHLEKNNSYVFLTEKKLKELQNEKR